MKFRCATESSVSNYLYNLIIAALKVLNVFNTTIIQIILDEDDVIHRNLFQLLEDSFVCPFNEFRCR